MLTEFIATERVQRIQSLQQQQQKKHGSAPKKPNKQKTTQETHTEAHSTKQCDVGPCSQCATGTSRKEERKRPWKRVRVQGLVAWCLRWITVGQCLAAAHKWGRSCIEGVPPPKGKRGLLVLCCCCCGCLKPDGGGGAEWHAHTHVIACEQAQAVLHPRVLLCRVASRSSASQVEETRPLVAGEQQKREGQSKCAAAMPIVVVAGTGCVLDASRRVRQWALQWWRWFVMAVHSSCSVVSSQT